MKISISYPPLESTKGVPLLSQNRQFQWFSHPCYIYPMVPAYAATLLKENGYDVYWHDGIAEEWSYQRYLDALERDAPDLIAIESKTPVIKTHWRIIDEIKDRLPDAKIALMGDHVTALPQESLENSRVDYVLTGGDYDFLLHNLCDHLTKDEKLEPGIWYREDGEIKSTGAFQLNHDLNSLPLIDRELTKWHLYSEKNGNYKRVPGTYTMVGRDCWWGKCTFCVDGESKISTEEGLAPIKEMVEEKKKCGVLTHRGRYKRVTGWHKRPVNGEILRISALYLPFDLKVTPNHRVYSLAKESMRRCSKRCAWNYRCIPDRISKFIDCRNCKKKYYANYRISLIGAENLRKGDFLVLPINRDVRDIDSLDVKEILDRDPTILKTWRKISQRKIDEIFHLTDGGLSQRAISGELNIDRETVNRYLLLRKINGLEEITNPLTYERDEISFKGGQYKIPSKISLSEDFFLLAGLYIAEGHVHYLKNRPNSATLCWTFNKNEETLIEHTRSIFRSAFDNSLNEVVNTQNNTRQLYIGATILAKLFKVLFGGDCYGKKIPQEFLYLPLEKQRALLRGIFMGDGHLRKRENKKGGAEYILATASKKLAEDVFFMLLRFNALPSFRISGDDESKYEITLFRKDIPKVFPEIKFDESGVTYKKGFVLGDSAFIPVTKIRREKFEGVVYNLTVEEDHSYIANFVAVKNCSWTSTYPSFRTRSPESLLDEIGELIEKYRVKEIFDDTGTFPTGKWLEKFCNGMIERGYNEKICFSCNMRFGVLKQEDYELMKKAGFRMLLFGLESANQSTLDRLNKGIQVEDITSGCEMAKKAGLEPHLTVMVGYPWETKEDAGRTLGLAKELFGKGYADTLQATIVIPYPGAPLFEECKKNGWLKTEDWPRYDMREGVMTSPMSDEELRAMTRGLYKVFFTPQYVARKLFSVRSLEDLRFVKNGIAAIAGHLRDFSKR